MTRVLVQLELVSNGRTARPHSSASSDHPAAIPTLGQHDAPHLYWRARWEDAVDDFTRELVLNLAVDELDAIRRAPARMGNCETLEEMFARIVQCAHLGFTRREVAVAFHTSEAIVARAWREAKLDEITGRPLVDLSKLPAEVRRARVRDYAETSGGSARAVARSLRLNYSTVLRDLGRKS